LSFQFVLLLIAALSLMAVDYRNPTATAPLRTGFSIIGYPLQLLVDAPFNVYSKVTKFFSNQSHLASENAALKEQLRLYSVQYRDMQVLEQQNSRLRELLKVDKRMGYTFTMAEVIAAADERGRQVVTLNKGSRDGVHEKQVVLAEGGNIFGQVVEVTPFSSKVMELTDRQHSIPVRNQRTGMRALANGTGKSDLLELKSIMANSNVQDGDIFVSSGLDMLFPPDFPVAKVMPNGVQYIPGDPFANISAKPLINFDNTRELLLLWRTGPLPSAVVSPPPVEQAAEAAAKPKPAEQVPAKDPKKKENKPEAKPDNKPTASNKPTERPQ
jgi:rod shape-determining protein MreC